ncbi:unnamed protein product [Clavelina lepadiformis]|uniref:DRBM domain-containing protein n=1 Tax=Clavelina lepadiformis TaxID=159417 RepID=A0ABP0EX04_CLALP
MEYCQKLGKTPQYDLTALEGRAHQPQFVYRCMVGDVKATGQGGSKKQAKHAAAEAVLKTLTAGLVSEDALPFEEKPEYLDIGKSASNEPDDANPVGSLQELVVARGWRLPEYTLAHETGPAHKKEFIICCTVESFKEYGSGSAKKHAKRLAASNMYRKIINLPPEAKESVTNQSREAKNKLAFNELSNSIGEKLKISEINCDSNLSSCQTLHDLASQNNFEVVFKDIGCMTSEGDYQCLVELTTQPPNIVHGLAKTRKEAHTDAATNALELLKVFTVDSDENL